jgi:formylglycine-generating enzyme required for sulfatase activity
MVVAVASSSALLSACALIVPDSRVPMARVPDGWFVGGSDEGERDYARRLGLRDAAVLEHEAPRQWAATGAFGIDFTPVTREEWARYRSERDVEEARVGWRERGLPATGVTYDDAIAYCEWRGEREGRPLSLPTDRMWERASRGDEGRIFPWGNRWDASRSRSAARPNDGVAPVWYHSGGASPYGLLDTCGNTAEWVWSPPGSPGAWIRGCSYEDLAGHCRSAARRPLPRDTRLPTVGFRCATPEVTPPPDSGPPDLRMSRGRLARLGCALLRWFTFGLRRCADSTVER